MRSECTIQKLHMHAHTYIHTHTHAHYSRSHDISLYIICSCNIDHFQHVKALLQCASGCPRDWLPTGTFCKVLRLLHCQFRSSVVDRPWHRPPVSCQPLREAGMMWDGWKRRTSNNNEAVVDFRPTEHPMVELTFCVHVLVHVLVHAGTDWGMACVCTLRGLI